ncbi:MAG: metal ABC transporter permease [Clostridiales bacterium]|jgi:zinc transport system permease protein|nr:metal ABC transporter permease [Clostridiales bacterium]
MFSILQEYFSYAFVVRALYVGIFVALCSALLGVSLVLKRYSMIGDGLSHVGFGTLAIAMALNLAPLQVSIPLVLLAAFLLLRVSENSKIKGDAAIALISSSSLALGGIIIAVSTGMGADVCNYMFGAILAMRISDVYLSIGAAAVVLILYLIFYNRIFTVTFDESFAKATGTKVGYYNMLIAFLTALVIVVGMRMMGAMLISGLIIFPALTSMRILKSFKSVVITSAVLAVICFFLGMVLSLIISTPKGGNIPPGASIVAVNLGAFCLFLIIGALKKWNAGHKLRQDLKEAAK